MSVRAFTLAVSCLLVIFFASGISAQTCPVGKCVASGGVCDSTQGLFCDATKGFACVSGKCATPAKVVNPTLGQACTNSGPTCSGNANCNGTVCVETINPGRNCTAKSVFSSCRFGSDYSSTVPCPANGVCPFNTTGSYCSTSGYACQDGVAYCNSTNSATSDGVCIALSANGARCLSASTCVNSYCAPISATAYGVCSAYGLVGPGAFCDSDALCRNGYYCSAAPTGQFGVCTLYGNFSTNKVCNQTSDCGAGESCNCLFNGTKLCQIANAAGAYNPVYVDTLSNRANACGTDTVRCALLTCQVYAYNYNTYWNDAILGANGATCALPDYLSFLVGIYNQCKYPATVAPTSAPARSSSSAPAAVVVSAVVAAVSVAVSVL